MDIERGNLFWKGLEEEDAKSWVNDAYLEVVRWSANNLFEPPKCAAMKSIVNEMVKFLDGYNFDRPLAFFYSKIKSHPWKLISIDEMYHTRVCFALVIIIHVNTLCHYILVDVINKIIK